MPVEAKPLFRPDVLRPLLANFPLPASLDAHRPKLAHWAATGEQRAALRELLDWLRIEHGVEKPTLKLQDAFSLSPDDFAAEVKKARGKSKPLTPAGLKSLRDAYAQTIEPARARSNQALALERQISDLVNAAYGLTPDEVALMWQTAPPRMPVGP